MQHNHQSTTVTMKDVALKAGVSTATVSRALVNPEKVSAATRKKVEQAVSCVGYLQPAFMHSTKYSGSPIILVIVPDICDVFFNEIIRGIEATATKEGYLVLLADCAHQIQHSPFWLNLLLKRQISGVVLLGSKIPFNITGEELRNLPPMVMANEFSQQFRLPTVHIDNLSAAFEAVCYLHGLGHRRIACVAGPDSIPFCHYRLQGYIQALRRHDLNVIPQYIVRGNFTIESGVTALKQLMALPHPPDALFCHSDIMALGVLSQAKHIGLRIPQDLSLVGFDDIEQARFSDPKLTTVAQPRFEMGREAMLLLLQRLCGKTVREGSRLLNFELKIRGSSAAPSSISAVCQGF